MLNILFLTISISCCKSYASEMMEVEGIAPNVQ